MTPFTDAHARSLTYLGRAILSFPKASWHDALSHGQMQSKAWAVSELVKLHRNLGLVYLVGGWLGLLPHLLLHESNLRVKKIRSFDIDPKCQPIADTVNAEYVAQGWRFKAVTKDLFSINYGRDHQYSIPLPSPKPPAAITETCDTIINTSCDHTAPFARWWMMLPKGKLVLLQNNNFLAGGSDHVNTVKSLDEMIVQAPMSKLLFSGQLKLERYTRFMMIGLR